MTTTIKNALKQLAPKEASKEEILDEELPEEEQEPLDIQEIVNMITIRQYVVNSTANPAIDRKTVNYMNGVLLMLDKKIMSTLEDDRFKDYINYKDVRKAVEEVANINNIKSGLQRNPHTGHWEKIPK